MQLVYMEQMLTRLLTNALFKDGKKELTPNINKYHFTTAGSDKL